MGAAMDVSRRRSSSINGDEDWNGKTIHGYLVMGKLSQNTLRCSKYGITYALRIIRETEQDVEYFRSTQDVQHRNLSSIVEIFREFGHVFLATAWEGDDSRQYLTLQTAPQTVSLILSVCKYLKSRCKIRSCNLKPNNISITREGIIRLHDWYLTPDPPGGCNDHIGLAEWIHLSIFGKMPTKAHLRGVCPSYVSFITSLMNTDDISSHEWLKTKCPAKLGSRSNYSKKTHHTPLDFIRTPEELRLLMMHVMLVELHKGVYTDKYIDLFKFNNLYAKALAHVNDSVPSQKEFDSVLSTATTPLSAVVVNGFDTAQYDIETVWASEGGRSLNEDRCVTYRNLSSYLQLPGSDYACGVFDGHGGLEAAQYCVQFLIPSIRTSPHYPSDMKMAMTEGFKKVHRDFSQVADVIAVDAGTTATTVFITNGTLHVANLGDSGAILCRNNSPISLTECHRPDQALEKEAVMSYGGEIVQVGGFSRVEGMVSVTRSIGDRPCKEYLRRDPHVTTMELTPQDDFIVLATDGLWDVMSAEEVVEYVTQCKGEVDAAAQGQKSQLMSPMECRESFSSKFTRDSDQNELERSSSVASVNSLRRAMAAHCSRNDLRATGSTSSAASVSFDDYQILAEAVVAEAKERGSKDDITVMILILNVDTLHS
eukprot:TRINITY_DN5267_c0_g1_i1.p1 TRINITY_DN5267_c0_g1~~TRINITY_DN5267_c0_g1_i1.p1  ORF type:complete len:653 (+),score=140.33 TRINITY_DN5267_c0_g1_i1:577-2535(+)